MSATDISRATFAPRSRGSGATYGRTLSGAVADVALLARVPSPGAPVDVS